MNTGSRAKSVDTADVRKINSKSVIDLLRIRGPIGRGEISKLTGMSFATVCRVLDDLMQRKIVAEVASVNIGTAKRKTALIDMNASGGWVAAIDLGPTFIRSAAIDFAGNIHHLEETSLENISGEESVARLLIDELCGLRKRVRANMGNPAAVGVSCTGIVDPDFGVVKLSFNLELREFPLGRILSESCDIPVAVSNDVQASALAEAKLGPGREHPNFALINVGTGIGAGIVMNSRVQLMPYDAEFGLMVVAMEGDPERFGGRGYLESVASGRGIASAVRGEIQSGRKSTLADTVAGGVAQISAIDVINAAGNGDELSAEALSKAANYLGIAVVNIAHTLGLSMFVFSGDIPMAANAFWNPLKETVAKYEFWPGRISLEQSRLQKDAALLGVAMAAIDRWLDIAG